MPFLGNVPLGHCICCSQIKIRIKKINTFLRIFITELNFKYLNCVIFLLFFILVIKKFEFKIELLLDLFS
jgi:hypothetical protein